MPIRGVICIFVAAAVLAFFFKDEIYSFLKDELRDEDNNNEKGE